MYLAISDSDTNLFFPKIFKFLGLTVTCVSKWLTSTLQPICIPTTKCAPEIYRRNFGKIFKVIILGNFWSLLNWAVYVLRQLGSYEGENRVWLG